MAHEPGGRAGNLVAGHVILESAAYWVRVLQKAGYDPVSHPTLLAFGARGVDDWVVTVSVGGAESSVLSGSRASLQLSALVENPWDLELLIRESTVESTMRATLGLIQDEQTGYPGFDARYVVQGNMPGLTQDLFTDGLDEVFNWLLPKIELAVSPYGVTGERSSSLSHARLITDSPIDGYAAGAEDLTGVAHLRELSNAFVRFLRGLMRAFHAPEDNVEGIIQGLSGTPPGQIEQHDLVLWDGFARRVRLIEALSEHRDAAAVTALLGVVRAASQPGADFDPDGIVVALEALVRAGEQRVVPHIIRLVPRREHSTLHVVVASSLRDLGHEDLARALIGLLYGTGREPEIETLRGLPTHQRAIRDALIAVLESGTIWDSARAAWVLAGLGVLDALPRIRQRRESVAREPLVTQLNLMDDAIARLEELQRLPRGAQGGDPDETLPRPASGEAHPEQLPRSANDPELPDSDS